MLLTGKVSIITGGSMGIGKAIAKAFLSEGCHCVLAARGEQALAAAVEELAVIGPRVKAFAADVTSEKDVRSLVDFTLEEFSAVDILVNCAGIYGPIGPSIDVDVCKWWEALEINLRGTFLCTHSVLRAMITQGRQGKIINLAGGGPLAGDVEIPGGTCVLGATPDLPFVFDNEKWAHPITLRPFLIARAPVTNGEFVAFVADKGYLRREFWSEEGWRWREGAGAEHPVYWQPEASGRWSRRRYNELVPLEPHHPVIHVNWYEADAYCRWAGRRLPTEAEWEAAASSGPGPGGHEIGDRKQTYPWGDEPPTPRVANLDARVGGCVDVGALAAGDSPFGCRQMIGNVWEWTSTALGPYPGFVPDPYKEYSEPWFGTHKVLRGGCWATRSRLIRTTWRNFYTRDRRDVLAGFRTCAR